MLVCGYDGTPGSHAGFAEALRLGKELGCDVIAVFAYERSRLATEMKDLDDIVLARANEILAEAVSEGEQAGVKVQPIVVEGSVAEALVEAADNADARYIVVGSYGERPLKSLLVGSTPARLMHLSERPVLVVRNE